AARLRFELWTNRSDRRGGKPITNVATSGPVQRLAPRARISSWPGALCSNWRGRRYDCSLISSSSTTSSLLGKSGSGAFSKKGKTDVSLLDRGVQIRFVRPHSVRWCARDFPHLGQSNSARGKTPPPTDLLRRRSIVVLQRLGFQLAFPFHVLP